MFKGNPLRIHNKRTGI